MQSSLILAPYLDLPEDPIGSAGLCSVEIPGQPNDGNTTPGTVIPDRDPSAK
jgi:hypothetical protein